MTYKKSFTVEVRNGFKDGSIDRSVDRVPEELWTEVHNSVREVVTKSIPEKKKCRKAKMVA